MAHGVYAVMQTETNRLIAVASQSQTVTLNAVDSSTYTDNGGKLT